MKRPKLRDAAVAFAVVLTGAIAQPVSARSDHCFYKGSMYSDGGTSCQSGSQYKCDDGDWKALGVVCHDEMAKPAKTCEFGGITYSTGSASCQSGTQYRCEDGRWASIGVTCPVGDSPIKVVPSGRTCMFDGATVANSSTICRGGTTFLCSDGEWINVGTQCR